jgi:hypothetical protein
VAPVVSSGLENSKKGKNRYLAQESEGHDGDRKNHVIYRHRGDASHSITLCSIHEGMKRLRFPRSGSEHSSPAGQDVRDQKMRILEVSCWCVTAAGLAVVVAFMTLLRGHRSRSTGQVRTGNPVVIWQAFEFRCHGGT